MPADFLTFDLETLGLNPDTVILNASILCSNWDTIFGESDSGYVIGNVSDLKQGYIADNSLVEYYKEAVKKMKARTISVNFEVESQVEIGRTVDDSVLKA